MQIFHGAACPLSHGRTFGFLAILLLTAGTIAADDTVSQLTKLATAGDEAARVTAIDELAEQGSAAKAAVADLTKLLSDPSARIRAHAAYALGMIGLDAKAAAPALVKATTDPDMHVRREAIQALETTKPGVDVAGPALLAALEDPEPSVQVAALDALADMGPAAVPTLARGIANPKTRYWAALALGEFGPQAEPAVGALTAALDDKRPEVVHEVLIALAQIGPAAASAEPKVTPLLTDHEPFVRNPAAYALGRMGPGAAAAKPALEKAAQSDDAMLQTVCSYALAKIEPKDKAARDVAIELLEKALHDPNPRIESAALRGLMELDTPAAELAPQLTDCVTACDASMVPEMMGVLAASGEAGVPALAAALKRPEARLQAAVLLGHVGPAAHTAVPATCRPDRRRQSGSPPRSVVCIGFDHRRQGASRSAHRRGAGRFGCAGAGDGRLCPGPCRLFGKACNSQTGASSRIGRSIGPCRQRLVAGAHCTGRCQSCDGGVARSDARHEERQRHGSTRSGRGSGEVGPRGQFGGTLAQSARAGFGQDGKCRGGRSA